MATRNHPARKGESFHQLAHRVLVKDARLPLREIAQHMKLTYTNFYARLRGRVTFRPEEIRSLLQVTPDPRLVDFLLEGSSYVAVPRAVDPVTAAPGSPMSDGVRALEEVVALVREIELAERDGVISEDERAEIETTIHEAERALAILRRRLSRELVIRRTEPPRAVSSR